MMSRPEEISAFKREIRKYTIMGLTTVRSFGGTYDRRCLWDICGKSMIHWVLDAIGHSDYIDRQVVVTEDKEVEKIAEKCEAKTIIRPLETALDYPRDYTEGKFKRLKPRSLIHKRYPVGDPFKDVWIYTLSYLEETEGYAPDLILHADADYPMLTTKTVDRVIEAFFNDEEATGAGAYYPVEPKYYILNPTINRLFPIMLDCVSGLDRQDYPPVYRKGPLMLKGLPLKSLSLGERTAFVIVTPEEGLNVHDKEDLFLARCYMKRRLEKAKTS